MIHRKKKKKRRSEALSQCISPVPEHTWIYVRIFTCQQQQNRAKARCSSYAANHEAALLCSNPSVLWLQAPSNLPRPRARPSCVSNLCAHRTLWLLELSRHQQPARFSQLSFPALVGAEVGLHIQIWQRGMPKTLTKCPNSRSSPSSSTNGTKSSYYFEALDCGLKYYIYISLQGAVCIL